MSRALEQGGRSESLTRVEQHPGGAGRGPSGVFRNDDVRFGGDSLLDQMEISSEAPDTADGGMPDGLSIPVRPSAPARGAPAGLAPKRQAFNSWGGTGDGNISGLSPSNSSVGRGASTRIEMMDSPDRGRSPGVQSGSQRAEDIIVHGNTETGLDIAQARPSSSNGSMPFPRLPPGDGSADIDAKQSSQEKPGGTAADRLRTITPVPKRRFRKAVRRVMTSNAVFAQMSRARPNLSMQDHDFMNSNSKGFQLRRILESIMENMKISRITQRMDQFLPIVSPNSPKRRTWDLMILVLVLYNAAAVPLDAGFGYEKPKALSIAEDAVDVIFFIDILYNFRTAYVDKQGNLIRDSRKISSNYLRGWFSIDVLATIPFEYLALMFRLNLTNSVTLLAFLKTPRLLRLGRLLRFLEQMKNASVFRIVRLMATMCMISHWIACIWHFLYMHFRHIPWIFSPYATKVAGEYVPNNFLVAFFASSVLMMGDNVNPQNDIEYIFCAIVLVIGSCFMAVVVGNMALLVANMNVTAARHRTKMDMMSDSIRYLGMPKQIRDRVQEYFDYLSTLSHPGPEGMRTLRELPTSLYEDICALLHVRMIRNVPPFKECEEPFIMELVTRLTSAVYMAGEMIFRGGDVGREMYLISKGSVAVISRGEEIVAILKEGQYFGELALLATARRVATCACLTNCDLNVLNSQDLAATMKDYPMSASLVRQWAVSRLSDLNPEQLENSGGAAPKDDGESGSNGRVSLHREMSKAGGSFSKAPSNRTPVPVGEPIGTAMTPKAPTSTFGKVSFSESVSKTHSLQKLERLLGDMMRNIEQLEGKLQEVERAVAAQGDDQGGVLKDLGIKRIDMNTTILDDDQPAASASHRLRKTSTRRTLNGTNVKASKSMFNLLDS